MPNPMTTETACVGPVVMRSRGCHAKRPDRPESAEPLCPHVQSGLARNLLIIDRLRHNSRKIKLLAVWWVRGKLSWG
jgi:hypothetical protein